MLFSCKTLLLLIPLNFKKHSTSAKQTWEVHTWDAWLMLVVQVFWPKFTIDMSEESLKPDVSY